MYTIGKDLSTNCQGLIIGDKYSSIAARQLTHEHRIPYTRGLRSRSQDRSVALFFMPGARKERPAMPAISLPHTLTVTVRLTPRDFMKIDKLAQACNRTRAGLLRELVRRSELTGQADVAAMLEPEAQDAS
jgi:hypothetical protein